MSGRASEWMESLGRDELGILAWLLLAAARDPSVGFISAGRADGLSRTRK